MFVHRATTPTKSIKQIVIDELQRIGVHKGSKGESLKDLDYYSLRSLLAVKKAVES